MSVIATALKHLIAAGVTGDDLVRAVAEMEAARPVDAVAEKRRAYDRERKRAAKSTGIPPETAESAELVPSLDKETPPTPPKEINPNPCVGCALTRKAAGFGPPEGVDLPGWNEFCSQRKKPLSGTAYARITSTLSEASDVGWPPGELLSRSIESGWETVFIPKDARIGKLNGNSGAHRSGLGHGRTVDAANEWVHGA